MTERASGKDKADETDGRMQHRTITLADGRYMIFYTFGDEARMPESQDSEKEEDV